MPKYEETAKNPKALYASWYGKIQDALEREKAYRNLGKECVDLYEAKTPDSVPFSILYANTETLIPSVYNARPVPIVSRRFKDSDPVGKAVADVSTRLLKYQIDVESQDYDSFDDLMQASVLNGLLTNRGLARFRFVPREDSLSESVFGEDVRWDKFFHGYARTWKKVPWIGFEWDMTESELKKNFPEAKFDLSRYVEDDYERDDAKSSAERRGVKLFKVFEIWDKTDRKVKFFSPCYPEGPLRETDDPYGLTGFFPVPRPLNFLRKVTTLTPTPLYEHYRSQARELNELTRRLKAIIKAIKYRGAYNSAVEGIDKMLEADDNVLVPVENVQSMPDGTSMDKLLWIVPVQELIATAQQLSQQREATKQVIYEITGISDILRGASVASETATAQNLKNQWGSLRLKKMQKEVQRYCRDCLAIILEIAGKRFEITTIRQMTGATYLLEQEKAQVKGQLQMQTMQAQATGAPPPEVPLELQAALARPSWEDIQRVLQNNLILQYKAEVETNSTIDAEASQDKQDISELLNALSQFLNGLGPLVEKGVMSFDLAKQMLLIISRRYNFGSELEEAIMAMEGAQQQQGPDPAEQAKAEQLKAETAAKTQQAQLDMQMSQMEFAQKKELMQLQAQVDTLELQMKEKELSLQMRAVEMKLRVQEAQHLQKMQQIAAQATAEEAREKEPSHASL